MVTMVTHVSLLGVEEVSWVKPVGENHHRRLGKIIQLLTKIIRIIIIIIITIIILTSLIIPTKPRLKVTMLILMRSSKVVLGSLVVSDYGLEDDHNDNIDECF